MTVTKHDGGEAVLARPHDHEKRGHTFAAQVISSVGVCWWKLSRARPNRHSNIQMNRESDPPRAGEGKLARGSPQASKPQRQQPHDYRSRPPSFRFTRSLWASESGGSKLLPVGAAAGSSQVSAASLLSRRASKCGGSLTASVAAAAAIWHLRSVRSVSSTPEGRRSLAWAHLSCERTEPRKPRLQSNFGAGRNLPLG